MKTLLLKLTWVVLVLAGASAQAEVKVKFSYQLTHINHFVESGALAGGQQAYPNTFVSHHTESTFAGDYRISFAGVEDEIAGSIFGTDVDGSFVLDQVQVMELDRSPFDEKRGWFEDFTYNLDIAREGEVAFHDSGEVISLPEEFSEQLAQKSAQPLEEVLDTLVDLTLKEVVPGVELSQWSWQDPEVETTQLHCKKLRGQRELHCAQVTHFSVTAVTQADQQIVEELGGNPAVALLLLQSGVEL